MDGIIAGLLGITLTVAFIAVPAFVGVVLAIGVTALRRAEAPAAVESRLAPPAG
ncbi:MAG: hypothetical protein GY723_00970 [bacterium]|nr:hypothetical protein [bacterium]MCP5068729.1 hypothetical protein [bacterium]